MTRRSVLLIVDDDAEVLRSLAFMAGTRGYAVVSCASAREAMTRLNASVACMILDQNMPDLSGDLLLQQIRATGVTAPALLMTTNPTAALRQWAAKAGAPIVEKPLLDEGLFDQIERLIASA